MRPDSIRKFDIFFLASVAMGAASSLLNYETQVSALTQQWEPMGLADQSSTFILGASVVSVVVNLVLWYLASRMRQGWVKWVLAVFVAYTLFSMVVALTATSVSISITAAIALLLKAIAVYFLFQSDAKEWFASKGE